MKMKMVYEQETKFEFKNQVKEVKEGKERKRYRCRCFRQKVAWSETRLVTRRSSCSLLRNKRYVRSRRRRRRRNRSRKKREEEDGRIGAGGAGGR